MHFTLAHFQNCRPLVSPTDDARVKTQWLAVGALLGCPVGIAFGLMVSSLGGVL